MIIIWRMGGKKYSHGKTVAKAQHLNSATVASDSLFADMRHCKVEIRVMSSDFGSSISQEYSVVRIESPRGTNLASRSLKLLRPNTITVYQKRKWRMLGAGEPYEA
jgi:hypothetical protein